MVSRKHGASRQRRAIKWLSHFRSAFAVTMSLAGLISAPNAYAQDTGWKSVEQLQPLVLGDLTQGFDFTGYSFTHEVYDLDGDDFDSDSGTAYGSDYGLNSYLDYVGTSYRSWKHTESGQSTYYWHWTPPEIPAAYVSEKYFEQPDLFLFASIDPRMSVTTTGDPTPILASLEFNVGTGWSTFTYGPTGLVNPPVKIPDANHPRRAIFKATPYGTDAGTVSQTLNPSVTMYAECPPDAGEGIVDFYLERYIAPILLDLPGNDVFGLPQTGDGKNQFVYSDGSVGTLQIPMKVKVEDATELDGAYLKNKVGLLFLALDQDSSPKSIPNTLTPYWVQTNGGGGVELSTQLPDQSFTNKISVNGLPPFYEDFGTRVMQLQVSNQNSQKAYIQTFFPASVVNNPGASLPNWYYYYNQYISDRPGYSPGQTYYHPGRPGYYPASQSYESPSQAPLGRPYGPSYYDPNTGLIKIHDDAYTNASLRIFAPPLGPGQFVTRSGSLIVEGIHRYLTVAGHEAGHKYYAQNTVPFRNRYIFVSANNSPDPENTTPQSQYDLDQDGVDDEWEAANGLDPTRRDTTRAYETDLGDGYGTSGDSQLLADVYSYWLLKDNKEAWREDWAKDGLQFGVKNLLGAKYPWYYKDTAGTESSDPPSDAVVTQ